jgi:hypothetical protein
MCCCQLQAIAAFLVLTSAAAPDYRKVRPTRGTEETKVAVGRIAEVSLGTSAPVARRANTRVAREHHDSPGSFFSVGYMSPFEVNLS